MTTRSPSLDADRTAIELTCFLEVITRVIVAGHALQQQQSCVPAREARTPASPHVMTPVARASSRRSKGRHDHARPGAGPPLRQELAKYLAAEKPNLSDYLLYPQKRTGRSERWNREVEGVIWEDRSKPLSPRRCIGGGIAAWRTQASSNTESRPTRRCTNHGTQRSRSSCALRGISSSRSNSRATPLSRRPPTSTDIWTTPTSSARWPEWSDSRDCGQLCRSPATIPPACDGESHC